VNIYNTAKTEKQTKHLSPTQVSRFKLTNHAYCRVIAQGGNKDRLQFWAHEDSEEESINLIFF